MIDIGDRVATDLEKFAEFVEGRATRLYLVEITVKVKGDEAIIRKVTFHGNRMVAGKYGLARNGEWIQVTEGESYPDECILPIEVYEDD